MKEGSKELLATVFHQPWWLNAATDGDYKEAVVTQAGRKVGSLPYVRRGMPPLTPYLGPAVDGGNGTHANRALRRAQVTRELLQQLPKSGGFRQVLHRDVGDTMVFQEQGFETPVVFAFEVAPQPADALRAKMQFETRKMLDEASQSFELREVTDIAAFAADCAGDTNFSTRRTLRWRSLVIRVCEAAVSRGQGRITAATTREGAWAGALFHVWDERQAICVLRTKKRSGGDGAIGLLLWHAMKDAASRGLLFDFGRVRDTGDALALNGFGAAVRPRYVVRRQTAGGRAIERLWAPFRRI